MADPVEEHGPLGTTLIIDDAGLCTMLRDYFALHNVRLTMRHHGEAGLESACREQYDMILLDIMPPGMDGLEVLRMREIYRRRTINAARAVPVQPTKELSVSGFVMKPATRTAGYRTHSLANPGYVKIHAQARFYTSSILTV
jgi:CheY-like chemotaxis protein